MTKASNRLTSLLHSLGVAGPAPVRAFQGTDAFKAITGTGAPSPRHALAILSVLATTLGTLIFASVPALAAAPESPKVSVEDTTAVVATPSTEAALHGVLVPNIAPGTASEVLLYEFVYRESNSACKGAGEVKTVPQGMSLGIGREEPSQQITGLKPSTEYTVCLLAHNSSNPSEETPSAPITFKTPVTPETPVTTSPAKLITATTATLEGTLNPLKVGEPGSYEFLYRVSATECQGESATPAEPAVGHTLGHIGEKVKTEVTSATPLQPNATYTFCLVAHNAAGEHSPVGNAVHFTTQPVPATIDSLSVSNIKSSESTLEGTVNPNNQLTECHFQYGTSLVTENTIPCSPEQLKGYGGQSVGPKNGEGNPQPIGGLSPGMEYHYQMVTKNGKGEESTKESTFKTAEEPEKQAATEVTAMTATLNGVLNPHNPFEAGKYEFVYRQTEGECERTNPVTGKPENEKATPSTGSSGGTAEHVSAKLTGLQPGAAYAVCLLERNGAGEEAAITTPETFTMPIAAPTTAAEYAANVRETAATLDASIDPNGAKTHYRFEYGTTTGYGKSTPLTKLEGSLIVTDTAEAGVAGLMPGTTYHYRVVAENQVGGKTETDKTLTTQPAAGTEITQSCPNEQLRAEQPFGLKLPDCRAYEMVSPVETIGQDATDSFAHQARAAVSGDAIMYASRGTFANPTGETLENEFIGRRGPEGWSTQSVTPLHDPVATEIEPSFEMNALTPELAAGVANTNAALTAEAPVGNHTDLYVDDFSSSSYGFVADGNRFPLGTSTDLSHVVFGEFGEVFEWVNGKVLPVSVTNENDEGDNMNASVGAMAPNPVYVTDRGLWHAVSAKGSRVYFTSPQPETSYEEYFTGQLYVRENADQPQSRIATPEAGGTGTLTEGSNTVTSLVVATGGTNHFVSAGSTEIEVSNRGRRFVVGQPLAGPGIAPGTTITNISGETLTLSTPTSNNIETRTQVSSDGPVPFAVGQKITGNGIPRATTITAVAPGSLTLSAPAASSGSAVELDAGGGCTVASDACTIEVSASQRELANPAGAETAWYRGASADGSRVFFTSDAELTEDAYTGPAGNAANLYEYDLERPEGERLKDLTVDKTDTDGAAVLNVVQISEDGSYVYFVAEGDLASKATARHPNLYVSHDGGAPVFITTLAANDVGDWFVSYGLEGKGEGGPEINTAVVTPSGNRLAFLSEESLTGYDNEQAESGKCEGTIGGATNKETGKCQEVYLYDAETGELVCASCNPTGARPIGPSGFTVHYGSNYALYRPRNLVEDGTLFFDSSDALVPHASDGRRNVYEYENGHVYPISNVAGGFESFFLDASANGANVFLGSADQLLPQDVSSNVVVYDARVGGGFPVRKSTLPCETAEACRTASPPTPSVFGAPPSATFSGPGNLGGGAPNQPAVLKPKPKPKTLECAKGFVKKKVKKKQTCIRKKSKKRAKRASRNRRGNS